MFFCVFYLNVCMFVIFAVTLLVLMLVFVFSLCVSTNSCLYGL
jgi:hypothetical protein